MERSGPDGEGRARPALADAGAGPRRRPEEGGGRARRRVRVRVRRRRRRRTGRRLLGLAVAFPLALGLDALWAASTGRNALTLAQGNLARGSAALAEGDAEAARDSFLVARDAAGDLAAALGHPAPRLAALLPWLDEDLAALRAVAGAADLAGASGEHLVAAARAAGWFSPRGPSVLAGGRVRLAPIERAAPDLILAARGLERAADLTAAALLPGLDPRIGEAVGAAARRLREGASVVGKAADAAALLPDALGAEGPRRYLLALLNLSDPRASGGFFGMYGVLEAERGRIRLVELAHTHEVPPVRPPVPLPPELERLFGVFGSARRLYQTTYPPDFPTAARTMLAVWERAGREPVDGVLALDPVALARVLEATGPVEVPAWPDPLTARTAVDVLERETFLLPQPRSDRVQEAIARAVVRALLSRGLDAERLAPALADAAASRHLQLYLVRRGEQALAERLGAAGDPPIPPNPLMVSWQGASASRAGYFAQPTLAYRAQLGPDGSAAVTLRAALRNAAPAGPPSILLGDGVGEPVGGFSAWAMAVLPGEARVRAVRLDGAGAPVVLRGRLDGHPVVLALVQTRPGETRVLEIRYALPPGWVRGGRFDLGIVPPPALRPTPVRVEVAPPPGATPAALPPGARAGDGAVVWESAPTQALSLSFGFSRAS